MKIDCERVNRLKELYPAGTRLELTHEMSGERDMPAGTQGTVIAVDNIGNILMSWDNGRSLNIVPGEDSFKTLSRPMPSLSDGKIMTAMSKEDCERVYSDESNDKRLGCIGHLRFDHGSGNEFWQSWWSHQSELKTKDFEGELINVVEQLKNAHLIDTQGSMRKFCQMHHEARIDDDSYGFKIDMIHYEFYLRCNAHDGGYNYCYCYKK